LFQEIDGIDYCWIKALTYRKRGIMQVFNQLDFVKNCFLNSKKIVRKPPDAVIASSPHPFVSYFGKHLANKYGAKFVYEIRDLWPLAIKEMGGFSDFHPYILALKSVEKFSVKNADLVVSVKQGDFEYLNDEYNLDKNKFAYIPNGLDVASWTFSEIPDRILSQVPTEKFIIGYVGALSAAYDIGALISAAEKLSKIDSAIHFVIAGSGQELEKYKLICREKSLKNLSFLGYIETKYVPNLLRYFNLCYIGLKKVRVYEYGISANKIFEYMIAGKPILASYSTKYDPVVSAKCGISVSPENVDEIVAGVISMKKKSRAELDKLGQNGRKYFFKEHDFRILGKRYLELLRKL
jgi:glycosyltransferase involved in cell wall biosynthesis